MDKSVPRVTVWYHSAEPRDAKTMTLGTNLHIRTLHSCQILIVRFILHETVRLRFSLLQTIEGINFGLAIMYVTHYHFFWILYCSKFDKDQDFISVCRISC